MKEKLYSSNNDARTHTDMSQKDYSFHKDKKCNKRDVRDLR